MAALSAPYDAHSKDGELIAYPVAAATTIYKGALVALTGGYAKPAADTAGVLFAGVAHETIANPGAAGAVSVRVEKRGSFLYNRAGQRRGGHRGRPRRWRTTTRWRQRGRPILSNAATSWRSRRRLRRGSA